MNGNVGRVRGVNELEMLIHAGLAVEGERGLQQPQLAEAVPSVENGLWRVFPDGRMETTWTIRPGASWHDGAPLTPADLAFTARVGMERELPTFNHPGFDAITGVEVIGPSSVTVRWSRPFFEADTMFSSGANFAMPLPRHILEEPYANDRSGLADLAYWTTEFVGAGPFRVRDFVRSSHLVLEAYSGYAPGRPKIDEIEVRFISDLNTLVAHILAGEVELTIGRAISVEQAIHLRERWPDGRVAIEPGRSWTALYPQHMSPNPAVIADAQFRRALLHAIDRQELVDVLLHGVVPVAHSMVGPNRAEYPDVERSIVRYEYDLRRATQLVEGLGYNKGADGLFRDSTGQPLSVEVRSTGGDDFRDKEVLSIADHWQRAGIGVETVFIPRQRAQDREYRVTRPGFEVVSQGTEVTDLQNFHSRTLPTPENRFTGTNRGRYVSSELDAQIDRFMVTIPRTERMQVLAQIVRHMTGRLVVMGLYHSADVAAISNRLTQVPGGDPWNAHEWGVR